MILQQLQQDAERLVGDLPPAGYDRKPVKWVIHLDATGGFLGIDSTSGSASKKDKGKPRLVPFKIRSYAIRPLLLADKPTYTLGIPEDRERSQVEHAAYVVLLDRCAEETGSSDVRAIATFLKEWRERVPQIPEIQPDELITFAVDGRYPVDDPAVRRFWARLAGGDDEDATRGQCLVCGAEAGLTQGVPVFLKGIPQGQTSGVAPVSANAPAFESYGRSGGYTSPICRECGERFGKAANALLQDERTHYNIGPVSYLFWAPEAEWDPINLFRDPQPEEVRRLYESARRGSPAAVEDESPFYATAVSAAISRAVFRSWLHTTVGTAKRNLARWFHLQELVDAYGAAGGPLSVFRLSVSLYREARDIVARVPEVLFRCALQGGPLPDWLLLQAVQRNQAERGVTYPRAALIKTVLCSQGKEDPDLMAALNPEHPSPAYHCGRLLAELEEIQRQAVPGIKATLVDRYYSGASSAPARVFGVILNAAQDHLGKLRKNNGGAYARLNASLEEILGAITEFPRTLTVQDQALFSLGYYHQRAADRATRREAAEKKRAQSGQSPLSLDEDDEDRDE